MPEDAGIIEAEIRLSIDKLKDDIKRAEAELQNLAKDFKAKGREAGASFDAEITKGLDFRDELKAMEADFVSALKHIETAEKQGARTSVDAARSKIGAVDAFIDALIEVRNKTAALAGETSQSLSVYDGIIADQVKLKQKLLDAAEAYEELEEAAEKAQEAANIRVRLEGMESDINRSQKMLDAWALEFEEIGERGGTLYVKGFGHAQLELNEQLNEFVSSMNAVSPKMGALGDKLAKTFSKPIFSMVPQMAIAIQGLLPVIGTILVAAGAIIAGISKAAAAQKEFNDTVEAAERVTAALRGETEELNASQREAEAITARQEQATAAWRRAWKTIGDYVSEKLLPVINGVRNVFTSIGEAAAAVAEKIGLINTAEVEAAVHAQKFKDTIEEINAAETRHKETLQDIDAAQRLGVKNQEEADKQRTAAMEDMVLGLTKQRDLIISQGGAESEIVKSIDQRLLKLKEELSLRTSILSANAALFSSYKSAVDLLDMRLLLDRQHAADKKEEAELDLQYSRDKETALEAYLAGLLNEKALLLEKKNLSAAQAGADRESADEQARAYDEQIEQVNAMIQFQRANLEEQKKTTAEKEKQQEAESKAAEKQDAIEKARLDAADRYEKRKREINDNESRHLITQEEQQRQLNGALEDYYNDLEGIAAQYKLTEGPIVNLRNNTAEEVKAARDRLAVEEARKQYLQEITDMGETLTRQEIEKLRASASQSKSAETQNALLKQALDLENQLIEKQRDREKQRFKELETFKNLSPEDQGEWEKQFDAITRGMKKELKDLESEGSQKAASIKNAYEEVLKQYAQTVAEIGRQSKDQMINEEQRAEGINQALETKYAALTRITSEYEILLQKGEQLSAEERERLDLIIQERNETAKLVEEARKAAAAKERDQFLVETGDALIGQQIERLRNEARFAVEKEEQNRLLQEALDLENQLIKQQRDREWAAVQETEAYKTAGEEQKIMREQFDAVTNGMLKTAENVNDNAEKAKTLADAYNTIIAQRGQKQRELDDALLAGLTTEKQYKDSILQADQAQYAALETLAVIYKDVTGEAANQLNLVLQTRDAAADLISAERERLADAQALEHRTAVLLQMEDALAGQKIDSLRREAQTVQNLDDKNSLLKQALDLENQLIKQQRDRERDAMTASQGYLRASRDEQKTMEDQFDAVTDGMLKTQELLKDPAIDAIEKARLDAVEQRERSLRNINDDIQNGIAKEQDRAQLEAQVYEQEYNALKAITAEHRNAVGEAKQKADAVSQEAKAAAAVAAAYKEQAALEEAAKVWKDLTINQQETLLKQQAEEKRAQAGKTEHLSEQNRLLQEALAIENQLIQAQRDREWAAVQETEAYKTRSQTEQDEMKARFDRITEGMKKQQDQVKDPAVDAIQKARADAEKQYAQAVQKAYDAEKAGLIDTVRLVELLNDAQAAEYEALEAIVTAYQDAEGEARVELETTQALRDVTAQRLRFTKQIAEEEEHTKALVKYLVEQENTLKQQEIEKLRIQSQSAETEQERIALINQAIDMENQLIQAQRDREKEELKNEGWFKTLQASNAETAEAILKDFDRITEGMKKLHEEAEDVSLFNRESWKRGMQIGQAAVSAFDSISNAVLDITRKHAEAQTAIIDETLKQTLEKLEKARQAELEEKGFAEARTQEQLDKETAAAKAAGDEVLEYRLNRRKQEMKINEEYNNQIKAAEKNAAKEKARIQFEAAKAEYAIQIVQAVNHGIMAVLASLPNFILAGIAGAAATVQIGLLLANPPKMPKFQTGGIVPGSQFSGDRILAQVNSGELILNKAQQDSVAAQLEKPKELILNIPLYLDQSGGQAIAHWVFRIANDTGQVLEQRAVKGLR